jgi:predicted nucleotide-binding protein
MYFDRITCVHRHGADGEGPVVRKQETFFPGARFPVEVIDAASAMLDRLRGTSTGRVEFDNLTVSHGHSIYTFDKLDDWLEAYKETPRAATIQMKVSRVTLELSFQDDSGFAGTSIGVTAYEHSTIQSVLAMFAATTGVPSPAANRSAVPVSGPVIFIGHGHDPAWRDLKDHLLHQQGLEVQSYETGARAGHTIRDILEGMLNSSAFAILVLAAEDDMTDETRRARQNVVHELGLFQGRLGWHRVLLLVETGTDLFTNIAGIQQVEYPRGHIRETFGDVIATLRREFGISVSRT